MRVIGLDISTTTIGRCVIDFNESKSELLHIDYYKPVKEVYDDKNIDFLHMVSKAKKDIDQLIKKYKPEYIAVEDYIRFMKGASGASTIIPLSCLNRTICLHVFEKYPKIKLNICNVISIRTSIKKHLSLEKLPEKKEIADLMEKILDIKIPRPTKKTRKGEKEMIEVEDMADSVAVAFYCYKMSIQK